MEQLAVFLPNRGYFGASLVVAPTLLQLRRLHPGARIVGFSVTPAHACFRTWGLVDEFHHYRKPPHPDLIAPIRRSLRGRFDVMLNMRPGSEWVQLWSWMVPARTRWAFDQGFGRMLADHSITFDVTRYKAFNYLHLIPGLQVPEHGDLLVGWPGEARPDLAGRHLVLLPSGGDARKLWPSSGYAEIAGRWLDGHGDRVTVVVGPRESHLAAEFKACAAARHPGFAVMCGAGPQAEMALLRSAAAVVHNDCGPGHLAQLLDRPRVVIFPEWGDPLEWFRPGARARCLQAAQGLDIGTIPVAAVMEAVAGVAE